MQNMRTVRGLWGKAGFDLYWDKPAFLLEEVIGSAYKAIMRGEKFPLAPAPLLRISADKSALGQPQGFPSPKHETHNCEGCYNEEKAD